MSASGFLFDAFVPEVSLLALVVWIVALDVAYVLVHARKVRR